MSKNVLNCNAELHRGDFLMSNNGNFKAIYQEDGNFVIYGWSPIWASNTCGCTGNRVVMQEDCNLVMYDGEGDNSSPVWASATSYRSGGPHWKAHALLRDDGSLVVQKDGKVLWKADGKQ
ncbi:B-type lectin plumieribetin-like [Engraulis encrasicolus]|uniref:B-type lectin plumieribetin-like n=1 Tax=Engraulis encrasicolus TaxID=184585 RepID=UPI002FD23F09